MENKLILYHGSQQTVEFTEIRLQRYNKDILHLSVEER